MVQIQLQGRQENKGRRQRPRERQRVPISESDDHAGSDQWKREWTEKAHKAVDLTDRAIGVGIMDASRQNVGNPVHT